MRIGEETGNRAVPETKGGATARDTRGATRSLQETVISNENYEDRKGVLEDIYRHG